MDAVVDRLRTFLDILAGDLDEAMPGQDAAARAHFSRQHFDRLIRGAAGEPPGKMRRRLLLERAAYELERGRSVTEAALSAGYASPASFTRAFRQAFGHAPSEHVHAGSGFRIASRNGIHFHPPGAIRVPGATGRPSTMDLIDRMLEHDDWLTTRILETARELPDAELDRELDLGEGSHPELTATTLRELLDRLVFAKETWTAALRGTELPGERATTADGLAARWRAVFPEFAKVVRDVRDRNTWDEAFIDATCEPPETFVTGAAILHVMTHTAYRRALALGALRRLGRDELSWGDPIVWEREHRAT